jgi:hypothetical protein
MVGSNIVSKLVRLIFFSQRQKRARLELYLRTTLFSRLVKLIVFFFKDDEMGVSVGDFASTGKITNGFGVDQGPII